MAALHFCKKCSSPIRRTIDSLCDYCRKERREELKKGFQPVKFKK